MKILVISGFLGAGKTTFIRALAKRTKRDFVIMENEYGEVGIDGPILSKNGAVEASLNIWEMTEGCVCCSTKSDFASSILTIANTLDPEYLIVEPTGVGMLSRVMENIRQIEYERITLLSPITLLDGHSVERYQKEFEEIYCDQIRTAGMVLVSKMEQASEQELEELEQILRRINSRGTILTTHYQNQPDEWWQQLLMQKEDGTMIVPPQTQSVSLENVGLTNITLKSGNELVLFLQAVTAGVFGNICRAKGYLCVGKAAWLRFDVVDRRYTITGIEPMEDTRAVFIGTNVNRGWLREALQKTMWISPYQIAKKRKKQ